MSTEGIVYFILVSIYACAWSVINKAKKEPGVFEGKFGKRVFWLFVLYALAIILSCLAFAPQVLIKIFTGDYEMLPFVVFRYIVPVTLAACVLWVQVLTHPGQMRFIKQTAKRRQ